MEKYIGIGHRVGQGERNVQSQLLGRRSQGGKVWCATGTMWAISPVKGEREPERDWGKKSLSSAKSVTSGTLWTHYLCRTNGLQASAVEHKIVLSEHFSRESFHSCYQIP